VATLFNDSPNIKKKFLSLYKKEKRGEIEVCLNLKKSKYMPIQTVCDQVDKIKRTLEKTQKSDPEYRLTGPNEVLYSDFMSFLMLIDLLAESCLGRNTAN
jgi:hypothetical protein